MFCVRERERRKILHTPQGAGRPLITLEEGIEEREHELEEHDKDRDCAFTLESPLSGMVPGHGVGVW